METCGNCNRQIGKMETPFIHLGQIVCQQCYCRLQPTSNPQLERIAKNSDSFMHILKIIGWIILICIVIRVLAAMTG